MESTVSYKQGYNKNTGDTTYINESPRTYLDRSSQDLVNSSLADTTINFSPQIKTISPCRRLNALGTQLGSVEKKLDSDKKSKLLLEEKLKKIENDYIKISAQTCKFNPEPKPGVFIDFSYEGADNKLSKDLPGLMWCGYCKGEMATDIKFVNSSMTFMSSIGIFLSGGILGCFLLPYATNCCKSARIICKKCGRTLSN
jgi:LITAF-like zinc ribbon domain